ncbi:MAG TPA: cell wall hydrolase [Burkholderiales bacterium]|jgi:spore germination cell wall hydrolase CwlJ-like protein|nr:cell wall hydrolase [Burkholderiales bacterium]
MRLRTYWYRADREAWVFGLILLVLAALFAAALKAVYAYKDERRRHTLEAHRQNLACLARNVYFEARGEPLAGQYAIAEVTMNRKASALFPRTVCGVVYQKSAFSWTDAAALPEPGGEEWKRAWSVAEAVYYGKEAPRLQGALFYHATYVEPDWAKDRRLVARIGNHIFYR